MSSNLNPYPANVYAPSYYQGVQPQPSSAIGFEPRPYTYLYNPPNGQLTALQAIPQDSVAIQTDSDFLLFGMYLALYTGAFTILLTDSDGYQLMSGVMNSGAISQSSSDPTLFSPAHPFPAGGKILISITDLSNATNPLQIAFIGVKMFRVKMS